MLCFDPKGYKIACDKCGRELSQGGRSLFRSPDAAVETAKTLGWRIRKSSPYNDLCPHCITKH